MNKKFIFVILFAFLFLFPLVSAVCSLGANPLSMDAKAILGQTVEATWNFYNLHGDRITHIKVNKIEGPNWKITYEPELHEASYDVAGSIQTIEENVAVEPRDVVKVKPEIIPEGIDYVKHPKEEGYILVKPVKINIKVPENAELWKDYKFIFEAQGNCFMEPGAVIPAVATQLELSVKTITGEYYEKPVEEIEEKIAEEIEKEEKKPIGITGAVIGTNLAVGVLAISSFILIIVILFLLVRIKRTRLKTKKVKKE